MTKYVLEAIAEKESHQTNHNHKSQSWDFVTLTCAKCDTIYPVMCEEKPSHCTKCGTALFPPSSTLSPSGVEGVVETVVAFYELSLKQSWNNKIHSSYISSYLQHLQAWFTINNTGVLGYEIATRDIATRELYAHTLLQSKNNLYIPVSLLTCIVIETSIFSFFLGYLALPFVAAKNFGANFFGYRIGRVANKYERERKYEKKLLPEVHHDR